MSDMHNSLGAGVVNNGQVTSPCKDPRALHVILLAYTLCRSVVFAEYSVCCVCWLTPMAFEAFE